MTATRGSAGGASEVRAREPDLPWDVKNPAAVHVSYPRVFGRQVRFVSQPDD